MQAAVPCDSRSPSWAKASPSEGGLLDYDGDAWSVVSEYTVHDAGSLLCDIRGVVQEQSQEMWRTLGGSICGRSVTCIMPPIVAEVHAGCILPLFSPAEGSAREDAAHALRNHSCLCSRIVALDGSMLDVQVTVTQLRHSDDAAFQVNISSIRALRREAFNSRAMLARTLCLRPFAPPVLHCISLLIIDIVNSTETLLELGAMTSYARHERLQTTCKAVSRDFLHYVSLYESVGDSMLFVCHPGDKAVRRPQCSLLFAFACKLMLASKEVDVPVRMAASYGNVLAVLMDGQPRLFGVPVTKACRLQAVVTPLQGTGACERMTVCADFYAKLEDESLKSLDLRKQTRVLKGFGETVDFYSVYLSRGDGPTITCGETACVRTPAAETQAMLPP